MPPSPISLSVDTCFLGSMLLLRAMLFAANFSRKCAQVEERQFDASIDATKCRTAYALYGFIDEISCREMPITLHFAKQYLNNPAIAALHARALSAAAVNNNLFH